MECFIIALNTLSYHITMCEIWLRKMLLSLITAYQVVDIITKYLARTKVETFREDLGMIMFPEYKSQ